MRLRQFLYACMAILCLAHFSRAQDIGGLFLGKPENIPPSRRLSVTMPMRDGVRLAANVTLPEGTGPWPVILTRTPYGKDIGALGGPSIPFHQRGYVQVVQDTRGRGESEGQFGEFHLEKGDGFDTIEWIAKQPWCNGKVGMFGVSASGILANFAAMSTPPALVCNFVVVAHGCDFRFGSFSGGVFLKNLNERWYKALGEPLSQSSIPRIAVYDSVAASMDMKNHYQAVKAPTYNVCGWYDCFVESGIENFEGLQANASPPAKGNQKLLVGAFGHFPLNGKLTYPLDARKPSVDVVHDWFDYWLKGAATGIDKEPAVKYFLMGDPFDKTAPGNEWRTSDVWPPSKESMTFWLGTSARLLHTPSSEAGAASYDSDPRNPVPTIGGNNLFLARGPMDQSPTRERKDVLRFESEPLASPIEIVGRVRAQLIVSTDGEDTDFMVKLVDIYPNGYEALVLDQAIRLRCRNGFDKPEKAKSGERYPIEINLGTIALAVAKGHRLAVHVQSTNSPRFEPHSNTWEPVAGESQMRVARNTIHLGPEGSRILLPVMGSVPR